MTKDELIKELASALKECALEIAQIRNRQLTAGERAALDSAKLALSKVEN